MTAKCQLQNKTKNTDIVDAVSNIWWWRRRWWETKSTLVNKNLIFVKLSLIGASLHWRRKIILIQNVIQCYYHTIFCYSKHIFCCWRLSLPRIQHTDDLYTTIPFVRLQIKSAWLRKNAATEKLLQSHVWPGYTSPQIGKHAEVPFNVKLKMWLDQEAQTS